MSRLPSSDPPASMYKSDLFIALCSERDFGYSLGQFIALVMI